MIKSLFAEAAGFSSKHDHFDKNIELKSYWNDTHLEWLKNKVNITVICAQPVSVLDQEPNLSAKKLNRSSSQLNSGVTK